MNEPETNPVIIQNPEALTLTVLNTLEKMLPIELYFHDDYPSPNSNALTTGISYTQTYNRYFIFKDYYAGQYAAQFNTAAQKLAAKEKVNQFFSERVEKEYSRMNEAFNELQKALESGAALEIQISGYASRLGTADYNMNLTKRRINSVKNEILAFNNGILSTYINNGKLRIVEIPIGETEAPKAVSDRLHDKGNSIFSPEASIQRKVNIDFVRKQ